MTPIRSMLVAAAAAMALLAATAPPANAGLDLTFAGDGIATTPIAFVHSARAVVMQPDGKIVAGGGGIKVVRHLSDGSLDPAFGNGGIVVTPPPGTDGILFALALQSDGEIVVAGVSINGGNESVLVLRYADDGTLDASFGSGGMVVTTLAATARPSAVAVQADGRILVAGTIGAGDARDLVLLRYESDGDLDTTFDGDGVLTAELGPAGPDIGTALALQDDGRIVVGALRAAVGDTLRIALARYEATGSPDATFGTAGVVLSSYTSTTAKVVLQTDQKIVVGGNSANTVGITVARFLADGSPDSAFATNGVFTFGAPGINFPSLRSLAFQAPDRIVIGGAQVHVIAVTPSLFISTNPLLARLVNDGQTLDFSDVFDLGGSDLIEDVVVQPDGKIVGASSSNNDFTVIRYEPIVCGDGVISSTEVCDDSNTIDGDGCDHNCQPTGCGNGVATAGEACDDGNTVSGDCCSSSCTLEAAGNPCPADSNVCTEDVCNASGVCTHPPNTAPCNDGNLCTAPDTCAAGQCVGAAVACPLCQVCATSSGACVDAPRTSCAATPSWAKATLQVRNKTPDKGDALQWKTRDFVTPAELGDPTALTEYALCLYDSSAMTPTLTGKLAARQGACGSKPCWKRMGNLTFKYQDRELLPDGVASMLLTGKVSGAGSLSVKARGANIPGPTLPLSLPARVQLQGTNGACWEATYSSAGLVRNDARQFKGLND